MSAFSEILPVYSCSKLKFTHNLFFYHNVCLKRLWNLLVCTIVETSISKRVNYVRLCSTGKSFEWVLLPNPIEVNRTMGVRLGSITDVRLTTPGIWKLSSILRQRLRRVIWKLLFQLAFISISRFAGRQGTSETFKFVSLLLTIGFKFSSPISKVHSRPP